MNFSWHFFRVGVINLKQFVGSFVNKPPKYCIGTLKDKQGLKFNKEK